jgi:predicted ester cyclase
VPNTNCKVVSDMLLRQYNQRDITAVDDYIAENHIDHNPMPDQESGRAGVRKLIESVLAGGDVEAAIHASFGEGDLVCTRYTMKMLHREDFMGFPSAGKTTEIHVVEVDRVENGMIVESWGESNVLAVLQQLGQPTGAAHS